MSDDVVGLLLRAEADRLSLGVTPPPLDLLTPRPSRRFAPLTAAAATVVLVAGVALVATVVREPADTGPVPITSYGAVVPYDKDEPTMKFGDAPAPQRHRPAGFGRPPSSAVEPSYGNDPNPRCKGSEIAATLELASGEDAGRLRMRWTGAADSTCRLREDVPTVTLYDVDGTELARSTYTHQPPVENPPAVEARYLFKERLTGFTWTSSCGAAPGRAVVSGLTPEPFSADVSGASPPCHGRTEAPRLGLFGGAGVVPTDRSGLRLTLHAPQAEKPGALVDMVAEVANPTHEALSLSPCPTWLLEYEERYGLQPGEIGKAGTSGGRTTRMPCEKLPAVLESGSAVRFEVRERLGDATPDLRGVHPLQLRFGIAGTQPWEGTVQLDHGAPPAPVATVPWRKTPKPPGEPMTGLPPNGTILPFASLHPTIEGLPDSVRRGETLHYWVRVTNMATGGDPVSLDPCPGFVQSLSLDKGKRDIADEHYVNCDAAPPSIAAGTAIRLDMELKIPADAPVGTAGLAWKLGKLDFSGSESAMTSFVITD